MNFKPQNLEPVSRLYHYRNYIQSDKSIYWNYTTFGEQIETDLNKGCFNVSKKKVHVVHEKTFGYSLKVNPKTYKGKFIEKSEFQGRHDVIIHDKPCEPKYDKVYEKLLNNSTEYRYFYHKEPFVVKKSRVKNDFTMSFLEAELTTFTKKQHEQIHEFCKEFGIDFAELDILIHRKRLYIIDVNNIAGNGNFFANCKNGSEIEQLYINQIKSL